MVGRRNELSIAVSASRRATDRAIPIALDAVRPRRLTSFDDLINCIHEQGDLVHPLLTDLVQVVDQPDISE